MGYKQYQPKDMQELTKDNVMNLFNYCRANKDTSKNDIGDYTFMEPNENNKKSASSVTMSFDETRLTEKKDSISFLLGQLRAVHNRKNITFNAGYIRYDNVEWCDSKSSAARIALFSLAYAVGLIPQFRPHPNDSRILFTPNLNAIPIDPTYSPLDTINFPRWKISHSLTGQEPADD